jgi:hypothetical protein
MAKNEEKVMQFVEKELEANPDVSTSDLYERAKKVDSGVAKLSLRQFNARFPLQVKRRKSLARPARRKGQVRKRAARRRDATTQHRDAVRQVFLQFASDLAAAEERKDLVSLIAQVDRYVDKAIKVSRG